MSRQENRDERIHQKLMESDSENEFLLESSENEDHLSVRSCGSDTEQNISSEYDSEDDLPISSLRSQNQILLEEEKLDAQVRDSFYTGKDGSKWFKNP
ncbi:unnamed protein product [Parnassius apollo]|uniref:(apollo) hypothetical protein n=1 Tax=Parnassius apollo TaxID=110799 RepID=A0A8S3XSA3_PARAO|nr:unnamed protein product [Parnassius apollo]